MKTMLLVVLMAILPMTFVFANERVSADEVLPEPDEPSMLKRQPPLTNDLSPGEPAPCLMREPSVREVVQATWEQASLLPDEDHSRTTRARVSGYLPKISGGVARNSGDTWNYRYEPGMARVDQLRQTAGVRWDASIAWDLALFAYNPDELQITRETTNRARERRNLATEVIRIFFARQKILLRGMPKPGSRVAQMLAEETAALDAWTGGRFQKQWCVVKP